MKEYCLELASSQSGYSAKLNIMREYLQAYILRILYAEGFFRNAAFLGGTALRFLHGLPRFSEDLDFSGAGETQMPFTELLSKVKNELQAAGYVVSLTYSDKKTVKSSFIRFEGLMYEAGVSPIKDQKLSIKLEIDTNPPDGAVIETMVVNKYFPLAFLTYDRGSLFSGKLHALLSRRYAKGRDYFDLGWYLSKWKDLTPNTVLLANALKQTGWEGEFPSEKTWRGIVFEVVKQADWDKVKKDVENFLERSGDLYIFTKENVLALVKGG